MKDIADLQDELINLQLELQQLDNHRRVAKAKINRRLNQVLKVRKAQTENHSLIDKEAKEQ